MHILCETTIQNNVNKIGAYSPAPCEFSLLAPAAKWDTRKK